MDMGFVVYILFFFSFSFFSFFFFFFPLKVIQRMRPIRLLCIWCGIKYNSRGEKETPFISPLFLLLDSGVEHI